MISSLSPSNNCESYCLDFVSRQLVCLIDNTITFSLEKLQSLVDNTILFDDSTECEKFLEETRNAVIFLVISAQYEEIFIPRVDHMKHIRSIHICHETRKQTPVSKVSKTSFD